MTTFKDYVESLPLAEQRAIRSAERSYLNDNRDVAPLAEAFADSMSGYVDTPPGPYTHETLDKLNEV